MGNSTLIQDKSLSPSTSSLQEVSAKVEAMKRIMEQLNLYIHQLESEPLLHFVNNIEEIFVNQMLAKVKKFAQDLEYLKTFLYSSGNDLSSQLLNPNHTKKETSINPLNQATSEQKDNESLHAELDFLKLAEKSPTTNSRGTSEKFYSMIVSDEEYVEISHDIHPNYHSQIKTSNHVVLSVKQPPKQSYQPPPNKQITQPFVEKSLDDLKKENSNLKSQVERLEEKNQELSKRVDKLEEAFKLNDDKQKKISQMINAW